jgi:hypothetical protein
MYQRQPNTFQAIASFLMESPAAFDVVLIVNIGDRLARMFIDTPCVPNQFGGAQCLSWPIVTCAHVPRRQLPGVRPEAAPELLHARHCAGRPGPGLVCAQQWRVAPGAPHTVLTRYTPWCTRVYTPCTRGAPECAPGVHPSEHPDNR